MTRAQWDGAVRCAVQLWLQSCYLRSSPPPPEQWQGQNDRLNAFVLKLQKGILTFWLWEGLPWGVRLRRKTSFKEGYWMHMAESVLVFGAKVLLNFFVFFWALLPSRFWVFNYGFVSLPRFLERKYL